MRSGTDDSALSPIPSGYLGMAWERLGPVRIGWERQGVARSGWAGQRRARMAVYSATIPHQGNTRMAGRGHGEAWQVEAGPR